MFGEEQVTASLVTSMMTVWIRAESVKYQGDLSFQWDFPSYIKIK